MFFLFLPKKALCKIYEDLKKVNKCTGLRIKLFSTQC